MGIVILIVIGYLVYQLIWSQLMGSTRLGDFKLYNVIIRKGFHIKEEKPAFLKICNEKIEFKIGAEKHILPLSVIEGTEIHKEKIRVEKNNILIGLAISLVLGVFSNSLALISFILISLTKSSWEEEIDVVSIRYKNYLGRETELILRAINMFNTDANRIKTRLNCG